MYLLIIKDIKQIARIKYRSYNIFKDQSNIR